MPEDMVKNISNRRGPSQSESDSLVACRDDSFAPTFPLGPVCGPASRQLFFLRFSTQVSLTSLPCSKGEVVVRRVWHREKPSSHLSRTRSVVGSNSRPVLYDEQGPWEHGEVWVGNNEIR